MSLTNNDGFSLPLAKRQKVVVDEAAQRNTYHAGSRIFSPFRVSLNLTIFFEERPAVSDQP